MNKLKVLLLSIWLLFFSACGTGTTSDVDPDRGFDMWEYMTSTLNFEVEYAVYENGVETDYYVEENRMYTNEYERESSSGITTLYLDGNTISMEESSNGVNNNITIERYIYLGDSGVFQSSSIQLCSVDHFYETYQREGKIFNNVLMIGCISKSGVKQEFYYGYNEGIVAIYENDGFNEREWIKVGENPIF